MSITKPVVLDETMQNLVTQTQAIAAKLTPAQSDWAESDNTDPSYIKNKPEHLVTGVKGNSENAYRDGNVNITPANIGAYTTSQVDTKLAEKVDKVAGKQLSTEDYTTIEKEKLASLENIQVSTMPEASSAVVGKVYQYIGATNADYTNGYFYKCSADPIPGSYEAPDGRTYNYKITTTGTNNFRIYSNVKLATYEGAKTSSYGYKIYAQNENNQIVYLVSNNNSWYPSDFAQRVIVCSNTDEKLQGNWVAWANVDGADGIPIFDTQDQMNAYLATPIFTWERIDVQPAPEQYNDAKLRDKIGKLSDALGDDVLYTNYITDKTEIITTEESMGDSPIISTIFDTLLKELRIIFEYPSGVVPAFGSCRILSGDDLFNTKLNKNLPNGTYTFQGDFIRQESPLYFRIIGQNEGGSAVQIASTEQGSSSFTIDDTYEYNWIEVWIDTLSSSDPFRDSYKLVLTKDGESIKETMSRPKVPRSNATFTDHTYAVYDETNVPEGITINDGSFIFEDVGVAQPSDNPFLPPPLPAPTYTNIKVKGWDDLVNSIDVKVRGTMNNTSINAGVTSEIATFEFYNGNESQEQDVTLEGVLNFSVAIVDYASPVSIIFSIYDNLIQIGSYTVGIDTDGYKYINFKYTISDNIGVGNKLYKIKMTPINCNIT